MAKQLQICSLCGKLTTDNYSAGALANGICCHKCYYQIIIPSKYKEYEALCPYNLMD